MATKKIKEISIPRDKKKLISLKGRITREQNKIDKELDKLYEIGNNKLSKEQREYRDDLFSRHLKNNGLKHKVQDKLNKVVKKPVKDKFSKPVEDFEYINSEEFIITEKSYCEDLVMKQKVFNNLILKKDAEKVQDIIDDAWHDMSSKDVYRVEYSKIVGGTAVGYILRDGRNTAEKRDNEFEPS